MVGFRGGNNGHAGADPFSHLHLSAPSWPGQIDAPSCRDRGLPAGGIADRIAGDVSALPDVGADGSDSAHAVPAFRVAQEFAGMGHSGPGAGPPQIGPGRILSPHGRRHRPHSRGHSAGSVYPPGRVTGGRTFSVAVAALARSGTLDQPAQSALRHGGAECTAGAGAAPHRPAHLGLLRNLRDGRRQYVTARQFPGGSESSRRASHVAHQYRALFAVRGIRG